MSVCSQGGPHVAITHDALDLTVQGPPTPTKDMLRFVKFDLTLQGPPPTCSKSLNLDLTVQGPPDKFKLVHNEAHVIGKQVVGLLLEYFLLLIKISRMCMITPGKYTDIMIIISYG